MGPGLQNLFLALRVSVWSKHKEGEGGGGPGPPPWVRRYRPSCRLEATFLLLLVYVILTLPSTCILDVAHAGCQ